MNKFINHTTKLFKTNSSAILTGFGVGGLFTTAYFSSKATLKAYKILEKHKETSNEILEKKDVFKLVWKEYIPPAISATATMVCVISNAKLESNKTAAAYSLLTISEKAFTEYKEKVIDQFGAKKEQSVRDQIAQDRVNNQPQIIVSGSGLVLCYEMHTGRYFNSDIESIKKAQNTINSQMIRNDEATLNDFYYLLGLPQTSYSGYTGWTSDKMLDIQFSAVMSEDGKPCIAFEYNYIKTL